MTAAPPTADADPPLDRYAPTPVPLPRPDYRYPMGYQQDAVARLLGQLGRHRGALLLASTGLGKTVIATEVARRLRREGRIDRALVIAPNAVRLEWSAHLDAARLPHRVFNHAALDADPERSAAAGALVADLAALSRRTLLVIDECHLLRTGGTAAAARRAFARLVPAVASSGAPVLLMTATPVARELANLNAQLALLPHTAPNRALLDDLPGARAWRVYAADDIARLPVITVLTTPGVARRYGERDDDGDGTFVRLGLRRRYFPRLALHRVDTPVVAGAAVAAALDDGVFATAGAQAGLDRLVRLSLTSSPWALADCVARTIATPGPGGFDRVRFRQPPEARAAALGDVLAALRAVTPADDPKLAALLALLDRRCAEGGKVVVFVERLPTACYLATSLAALRPRLRVGCTVRGSGDGPLPGMPARARQRPEAEVRALVAAFAPVANGVRPRRSGGGVDVLVASDAWGIGVNLQDAATVVSYDLAWTPVELTQRAGRVLRLWDEPRTVDVVAFVPDLGVPTMDDGFRRLWAVVRRWERLVARHDLATRLGELPTLAVAGWLGELDLAQLAAG